VILPASVATLIGAHRGASFDAPENTLAAFDLAVSAGAELIEFDVRVSADRVLVVHHDASLNRTAGLNARVADLPLSELQLLDVGSWKNPNYRGLRIPTLDQVLDNFGDLLLLNVEIKTDGAPVDQIEERVAAAIERRKLLDRVVVSSFEVETILRLRRLSPHVRASLLIESPAPLPVPSTVTAHEVVVAALVLARMYGLVGVHLAAELISRRIVNRARELAVGILAWTVDEQPEMARLVDLGVDVILSNRPALLHDVVVRRRNPKRSNIVARRNRSGRTGSLA
jgi:glycerophosphoryl diester phosphodiesterase